MQRVHEQLPFRGDALDSEFTFRALVTLRRTINGREVELNALFPPTQHCSTESKHTFNNLLNKHLVELRDEGCKVLRVAVLQGGRAAFDFTLDN
jgi:hypothetical protein